jgi:hypothetical protein
MSIEMKRLRYPCEFFFSSSPSSSIFTSILLSTFSVFVPKPLLGDSLQISLPIHFNYQLASAKAEKDFAEVNILFPYLFIRSAVSSTTAIASSAFSVTQSKPNLSRCYRFSYLNKENENGTNYLFSYLPSTVHCLLNNTYDVEAGNSSQYRLVQFPLYEENEKQVNTEDTAVPLYRYVLAQLSDALSVHIPIGKMDDYMIVSYITYALIVILQFSLIFHLLWKLSHSTTLKLTEKPS